MKPSCTRCKKQFRDNYDLNRHSSRKTPCAVLEIQTRTNNVPEINNKSQNGNITIINNGTINQTTININVIMGQDDLSGIDVERIIDAWRNINKTTQEEYIRAGKLVTSFHSMVCENPLNNNVKLTNAKGISTMVLSPQGEWKRQPTDETVDQVIKVRSGQLISFRETIAQTNNRVFKIPTNQRTWKHIEQFSTHGREHQGPTHDQTRRLRTAVKVSLIE
jgi:hypothetical protein